MRRCEHDAPCDGFLSGNSGLHNFTIPGREQFPDLGGTPVQRAASSRTQGVQTLLANSPALAGQLDATAAACFASLQPLGPLPACASGSPMITSPLDASLGQIAECIMDLAQDEMASADMIEGCCYISDIDTGQLEPRPLTVALARLQDDPGRVLAFCAHPAAAAAALNARTMTDESARCSTR